MAGDKKMKAVDQFDGTSTTSQIAFFFQMQEKGGTHSGSREITDLLCVVVALEGGGWCYECSWLWLNHFRLLSPSECWKGPNSFRWTFRRERHLAMKYIWIILDPCAVLVFRVWLSIRYLLRHQRSCKKRPLTWSDSTKLKVGWLCSSSIVPGTLQKLLWQ